MKRTAIFAPLLFLFCIGALSVSTAQDSRRLNDVQIRIRERLIREQGGNNPLVRFKDDGTFENISNTETRVRGRGIYYADRDDRGRDFSYEAIYDIRYGSIRNVNYWF